MKQRRAPARAHWRISNHWDFHSSKPARGGKIFLGVFFAVLRWPSEGSFRNWADKEFRRTQLFFGCIGSKETETAIRHDCDAEKRKRGMHAFATKAASSNNQTRNGDCECPWIDSQLAQDGSIPELPKPRTREEMAWQPNRFPIEQQWIWALRFETWTFET